MLARLTFAVALASPLLADELAVFASGARLHADRHEAVGSVVRLFHGAGVTEVPASAIVDFEPIEALPKIAPTIASAPPAEAAPSLSAAPVSNDPKTLIRQAAVRAGLPPEFVASVAKVESAFHPDALSSKGAIGVMQLMPATAKALGADPHDLRQNIDAGTRLLRELLVQYDGDVVKALAAYNAGPAAVARYNGLPPFDETRRYVNKVIGAYQSTKSD
jgi:soluble lytic murein transglycosylase-like protein